MLTVAIIIGAIGWGLAILLIIEPGRASSLPNTLRHPGDRARRG